MGWKNLFHHETPRKIEPAEMREGHLIPADYFSEPCINGLHETLNRIGVNVKRIDKM